jgi:hypothetical protein
VSCRHHLLESRRAHPWPPACRFSPPPPGQTSLPQLCFEAQVVTFNQSNIGDYRTGGNRSGVFGSYYARNINTSTFQKVGRASVWATRALRSPRTSCRWPPRPHRISCHRRSGWSAGHRLLGCQLRWHRYPGRPRELLDRAQAPRGSSDRRSPDNNNLVASCLLQASSTVCQGVGQQTNTQAPAVTLTATGLTPDASGRFLVDSGVQFPVRRQVTNSPHVCVATSTATTGVVGWDNAFMPSADTSVNVRLSGSGEVTLRYRCYNEAGAAATPTSLVFLINAPVGPNPDACSLPSSPNINPAGFVRHVMSWNDLFGTGPFPGYTTRSPVGSYTVGRSLPGPLSAGMFITVPITVEANRVYTLRHYPAQFVGSAPPDLRRDRGTQAIQVGKARHLSRSAPVREISVPTRPRWLIPGCVAAEPPPRFSKGHSNSRRDPARSCASCRQARRIG